MTRITQASGLQNPFQKVFPNPVVGNRAPTTSDANYPLGQVWVYKTTGQVYMLGAVASGSATWALASPGASDVDTLTGDGGGAISPAAGNITLAGGTNITTAGAGSTITFNLDAAISLATSVTSPIYTTSAADMAINAAAGQNIIVTMGDSAGGNNFTVQKLDGTDVFVVDSSGTITFSGLTVTGAFAQTGGTFNVGQDNAANAVNIGGGTTARAIAIGNGTGAHTVAIGQAAAGAITVDTAAGVSVDAATASNFTVTGASADLTLSSVGGSVVIDGSEAVSDAVRINASNAGGGIDVDFGTGGMTITGTGGGFAITASAVSSIGTTGAGVDMTVSSGAGRVIVNGEEAAADAVRLLSAAGGLDADVALQMNLASSQNAADAIVISASAGGIDITAAGAAGEDLDLTCTAGSANLTGGEADAAAVRINASNAAGGIDVDAGTGGIAIDSTGAISLDGAAASNFTVTGAGIDLTLSSAAGRVVVNGEEAAADAVRILSAAGGLDVDVALQMSLVSSQNAADAIVINSSAGGIDITAAGAAGEDIDILNSAGSVTVTGAEAASDAVVITASNAAGGVQIAAGSAGTQVSGNLLLSDVATQFQMNGGAATDFIGTATLVNGQVTVANTNIAANDRIFIQRTAVNASTALGFFQYSISAGASFTVEARQTATPGSDETGDQSSFTYVIIRQN